MTREEHRRELIAAAVVWVLACLASPFIGWGLGLYLAWMYGQ